MEIRKIIMKIAYGLVGLSILVLIGLTILQYHQAKKVSQDAATVGVMRDDFAVDTIPGQAETSQEKVSGREAFPGEEGTQREEINELEHQLYRKILDDPVSEKMLRTTFKGELDIHYGPLFEELDLSPEKQYELGNILIDGRMATLDISREMLYDSPSEEDKRGIVKRFQEFRKEYEGEIYGCLGEQDYEIYEAYQERLSERILVNDFMETLNPDDRLSRDQEKRLVDSMYEQRKALYSEIGYDPEELVFPSEMDDRSMARDMERVDRTYARYTEGAGMILNKSQMERFRIYLGQERDRERSSLKMLRQMYGS